MNIKKEIFTRSWVRKLTLFLLLSLPLVSHAVNPVFKISFKDSLSYVQSLNDFRSAIGTAMPNVDVGGTRVFQINSTTSNEGIIIELEGVDYTGSMETSAVRFVLNPVDLYVTGYIYNQTYYHFSDQTTTTVNERFANRTVSINLASDYLTMERFSGKSRLGLDIDRSNLSTGLDSLISINPESITRGEASAFLRYATVLSEAIRFRQLQRNIRPVFDSNVTYNLTDSDIALTVNWQSLSSMFLLTGTQEQNQLRTGSVFLNGNNAILLALGLIKYCQSPRNSYLKTSYICGGEDEKSIKINGVIWDYKTLTSIIE